MSEPCPFRSGRAEFDKEESRLFSSSPDEQLNNAWQKVLENRVTCPGSEWPSVSSLLSEDYSSVYDNKIDVQEAKTKVSLLL